MPSRSSWALLAGFFLSGLLGSAVAGGSSDDDDCVYDDCGSELALCVVDDACNAALNMSGAAVVGDCYFDVVVWAYCYTYNCTGLFTNLTDCYSSNCVDCANTTAAPYGATNSSDSSSSGGGGGGGGHDSSDDDYCLYGDCYGSYMSCLYSYGNCTMELAYSGVVNASDCEVADTVADFCGGDYVCSDQFLNLTTCYVNNCADCDTTSAMPTTSREGSVAGGGSGDTTTTVASTEEGQVRGAAAGTRVSLAGLAAVVAATLYRW